MTASAPSSTSAAATRPTRPCPACGAEWADEIRYCGECGGRMPDATLVAAAYKVQVEATDVATAAPIIGPMSEALVPTLVPDAPLDAEPPLLDVERLDASANTLADVTMLDTRIVVEAWRLVAARLGPLVVGTLVVALASSALSSTIIGLIALGPVQGGLAIAGLRVAVGSLGHDE